MKDTKLYTIKEVSSRVGLGIAALHRLIAKEKLTALQPGGDRGKFFIPEDELERLQQRVSKPQEGK